MKSILFGAAAFALLAGGVWADQAPAAAPSPAAPAAGAGLQTGPATVAPHWSKYKYPESVPEGATYHIVERGDTMWDLSAKYLSNPYLWPQIWDQNRYVTDAHWIYPGDPLILPKLAVVAPKAGQEGATGLEEKGPGESAGGATEAGGTGGAVLSPVTEEDTLQCAHYIVPRPEDESLVILGTEGGNTHLTIATRDIIYLNKGSNQGIRAGDVYTFHHEAYDVRHPETGRKVGTKVETTGWGRVILVEDAASTVMVDLACTEMHIADYAKPLEKLNVPLVLRRPPSDRLTPHSGKVHGYVIDLAGDATVVGTGHFVSLDIGSDDGLAPGNILSVYRIMYPSVPTPRNVLGEIAVVSVLEKTATAKITYSRDAIMNGDEVELR